MARPQQEDATLPTSSSMKRSPLTPITIDGHRAVDDPKLTSPVYPSVSRCHSDDDLRQSTLQQHLKSSAPGLFITRLPHHRRRSHNRRPSPVRNSSTITASFAPIHSNFHTGRRTSLPALHFHETVKNVTPLHIDHRLPQRKDCMSEDLYGTLQSFKFGAPPRHTTHQSANDEEDEDERQRDDRAKMRAIDDGTRRPSLPTNSSTPVTSHSRHSLSSLSSAGIVVGECQWDEHNEPDWNMCDTTPTKSRPPSTADTISTLSTQSIQTEPRRPSVPIDIPLPVLRRRSHSAGELTVDLEQRMHGLTPTQFSWDEGRRSPDNRATSSSPEENAYAGYDLNFILSQNNAGEDSHLKRQASTGLLRGKFRGKAKTAVQSRFEDTFVRHIMDSDPIHKQRQAEWTFQQETPNHVSNGSPKGNKDKDRSFEEIDHWRCEWVGKFTVQRLQSEHRPNITNSDVPKGSYDRLVIAHLPDSSNKGNKRGGPRVLVHRHSRAQAFSIFRAHKLQTQKAAVSTDSVLLAVKGVLRDYTRTESTRALKTYGLTDDGSSRSRRTRHVSGSSGDGQQEQLRRQSSRPHVNTTNGSSTSVNASSHQRLTASVNNLADKQSSQARSMTLSTRNSPQASSSQLSVAPSRSTSRPLSLALTESSNSPTSPSASSDIDPVPTVARSVSSLSKSPRSSTSHAEAFAMIDPDARDLDWLHHRNDSSPFPSLSATRVAPPHAASLPPPATPPHTQRSAFGLGKQLYKVFKSKQHQKEPASPVTDDGDDEPKAVNQDGMFAPPWLTTARRSDKEEHERMIRTLNYSFESVGLIPPPDKKKSVKPRSRKGNKNEESVLDDVPDDSMCMLLPLWPEETDSGTQGNQTQYHSLSHQSSRIANHSTTRSLGQSYVNNTVPLQDRKFLLVYYCHQLKDQTAADSGGNNNKKRRRPQTAGDRPHHTSHVKAPAVIPGPFYAAGRLLTYDNVRSSGVRLPERGLSVNGPIAEAAMGVPVPSPPTSSSDGFEVIAFCQGKETGVNLIHEGLVKLGLVDPQEDEETAKLSEIGRAIVEMVWCGCISLLSIMP